MIGRIIQRFRDWRRYRRWRRENHDDCLNPFIGLCTECEFQHRTNLGKRFPIATVTKTEAWCPEMVCEWQAFALPRQVRYREYRDLSGQWVVEVDVEATDIKTGETAHFKTTWRGKRPATRDGELEIVALTIRNALGHEVLEQLGLRPHEPIQPNESAVKGTI